MSNKLEPILSPEYWRDRLEQSQRTFLHHAIFKCSLAKWEAIEAKHREILAKHIKFADAILDCGCGWGRLLDLLPSNWGGQYLGIDISPDFVRLAEEKHQTRFFIERDLRDLRGLESIIEYQGQFDVAILISIRPMVKRNLGTEVWSKMEAEIRRTAKQLLFLEYDETDEGSLE